MCSIHQTPKRDFNYASPANDYPKTSDVVDPPSPTLCTWCETQHRMKCSFLLLLVLFWILIYCDGTMPFLRFVISCVHLLASWEPHQNKRAPLQIVQMFASSILHSQVTIVSLFPFCSFSLSNFLYIFLPFFFVSFSLVFCPRPCVCAHILLQLPFLPRLSQSNICANLNVLMSLSSSVVFFFCCDRLAKKSSQQMLCECENATHEKIADKVALYKAFIRSQV